MNADTDIKLKVTDIQRFCMHDGPGVRTTVFLKGCPLSCLWCHNPETGSYKKELLFYEKKCILCGACAVCDKGVHRFESGRHVLDRAKCVACGDCERVCPTGALEICGKEMTADEIVAEVKKDAAFYGEKGGATVSGGEPLTHKGVLTLLKKLKEAGLDVAVETCGYFDPAVLKEAVKYVDLFLWDVKDTDPERHKKYTGVSNEKILENLKEADRLGAKTRLRCILVNGVNAEGAHYAAVAALKKSLENCEGVDVLPYHAYGGAKAVFSGRENNADEAMIPSEEQEEEFKRVVETVERRCGQGIM